MAKKKKRLWKARRLNLDDLARLENVDAQGRLHLTVDPSPLPCDECGQPGPNRRWTLLGDSGVLCRQCLSAMIDDFNRALSNKADELPPGYRPAPGDICLQELRPGQFNLHLYQKDGTWPYERLVFQPEANELVASMEYVGEGPFDRRYYRPRRT